MSIEPSDRELLTDLSTDPVAFEAFYRRHVDRVIGFATRRVREPEDVADLVASTFVAVLTSAPSYDAARGEPTAWLLGIAARLLANQQRRRGREAMATARYARRPELDAGDIERLEDRLDAARSSRHLEAALDRITPRAREALLLVGADELTPSQAAQVVGISPAAFRMRLSAARRALAKALDSTSRDGLPPPRSDTAHQQLSTATPRRATP